jgi:hypothetical protein
MMEEQVGQGGFWLWCGQAPTKKMKVCGFCFFSFSARYSLVAQNGGCGRISNPNGPKTFPNVFSCVFCDDVNESTRCSKVDARKICEPQTLPLTTSYPYDPLQPQQQLLLSPIPYSYRKVIFNIQTYIFGKEEKEVVMSKSTTLSTAFRAIAYQRRSTRRFAPHRSIPQTTLRDVLECTLVRVCCDVIQTPPHRCLS